MKRLLFLLSILFLSFQSYSQQAVRNGWHLLDPQTDGYMGISLNKAYKALDGMKSKTVIVAVIDSGIDTLQEDLKQVLWNNPGEIPGNGKDDDGNGYADDIHGWNFCGTPDGQNMARNSHELERLYHGWKSEFEGKKEKDIPADKKFLYGQWVKAEAEINKEFNEARKSEPQVANFLEVMEKASAILKKELAATQFTASQLKPLLASRNEMVLRSAEAWVEVFARGRDTTATDALVLQDVRSYHDQLLKQIDNKLKSPENWRAELVKDDPYNIKDTHYGNNNLKSGSGDHGTLVAGTIAAVRGNGIGMDGIADNVRIMVLRCVPGGDEYDKDVALAIRYAVDNGASVVNMSFGKPFSPFKSFVDDAVKYAASKNVLLVHGSGNDGKDISKDIFYPNPVYLDGGRANNYITVGASGDPSTGGYAASFSNYGRDAVDVFAPGMHIYATATDNRYVAADGTSLSCPVVTGVAALLRSYFPHLTAEQIVYILKNTGTNISEDVTLPGSDKKVSFSKLCASGRILNAYDAVMLARTMVHSSN